VEPSGREERPQGQEEGRKGGRKGGRKEGREEGREGGREEDTLLAKAGRVTIK
jgi:flagellar biosynthesis/type III secretory pathway protein FliH